MKWRWSLLIFSSAILGSWTFFAVCYYIIAFAHGDFSTNPPALPCYAEVDGFAAAFLFSLESQSTIGYGSRHMHSECPMGVITLVCQTIAGAVIQSMLIGLMFTKLARSTSRAKALMFSKKACICKMDDKIVFVFRLCDLKKTHVLDAQVRLILVKQVTTKEGVKSGPKQIDMKLGEDSQDRRILLTWPVDVYHVIDEQSPLYHMSRQQFFNSHFEIVAILECVTNSTGNQTQSLMSYLPQEVLWGYTFTSNLVKADSRSNGFHCSYNAFDEVDHCPTPNCSPAEYYENLRRRDSSESNNSKLPETPTLPVHFE